MTWIYAGFTNFNHQSPGKVIYFGHDADEGAKAVKQHAGQFVRFAKAPMPSWIPVAAPEVAAPEAPKPVTEKSESKEKSKKP